MFVLEYKFYANIDVNDWTLILMHYILSFVIKCITAPHKLYISAGMQIMRYSCIIIWVDVIYFYCFYRINVAICPYHVDWVIPDLN